jgi:hypothetical protein
MEEGEAFPLAFRRESPRDEKAQESKGLTPN